jgi:hypothetical protein
VALVRKAEDKITFFPKSFGIKKVNQLTVTSYKLANNFASLITSRLGPDADRGLPVVPC